MTKKLRFFGTCYIFGVSWLTQFRRCAWTIVLLAVLGSTGSAAYTGLSDWISWEVDKEWTNKSLVEIKAAAEQGNRVAQHHLGRVFVLGEGVQPDLKAAFDWIERAATQSYPPSEFIMARFYYTGHGVGQDNAKAFQWAKRAADHGHAEAMALVGLANRTGEGTMPDPSQARLWFEAAVKAGSRVGPRWLADFYYAGEGRRVQPINYRQALHWYQVAATNGSASAAIRAADMWARGQGTPPDFQKSLAWIRLYADKNDPDALERLGDWYSAGLAESRNPEDTPIALLRRSTARRLIQFYESREPNLAVIGSCRALANRYRFGIGAAQDYVLAAEMIWLLHQVEKRYAALGQRFAPGDRPPYPFTEILSGEAPVLNMDEQKWQQAVRLIHEALEEEKSAAMCHIGEGYRDGSALTPVNMLAARAWFARAVELGYAPAQGSLKAVEAKLTPDELKQHFWLPPLAKDK